MKRLLANHTNAASELFQEAMNAWASRTGAGDNDRDEANELIELFDQFVRAAKRNKLTDFHIFVKFLCTIAEVPTESLHRQKVRWDDSNPSKHGIAMRCGTVYRLHKPDSKKKTPTHVIQLEIEASQTRAEARGAGSGYNLQYLKSYWRGRGGASTPSFLHIHTRG